jgi:hypothetical protein
MGSSGHRWQWSRKRHSALFLVSLIFSHPAQIRGSHTGRKGVVAIVDVSACHLFHHLICSEIHGVGRACIASACVSPIYGPGVCLTSTNNHTRDTLP